jgi:pyridoxine kinase
MPVIAALKIQPVAIPTALLSTHTGGFTNYSFLDLTAEMEKIIAHHNELDIKFDAVYSGFLGSNKQIEIITDYIKRQKEKNSLILIDPVMADDGKLYSSYTAEMKKNMINLVRHADVITPNITEAFFLLDTQYKEPPYSKNLIKDIICRLMGLHFGIKTVIITSVELESGEYGAAYCERDREVKYKFTNKYSVSYPGSGDIFSSVVCGYILNGRELDEAVSAAVEFIGKVVGYTLKCGSPVREGLIFEKFLGDFK